MKNKGVYVERITEFGDKECGYTINGVKEGEWLVYWKSHADVISFKGNYVNGKLEGVLYSYWDNGKLESITTFKNGKRDGYYEAYGIKTGKPVEKGYYSNDKQIGYWEITSFLPELKDNPPKTKHYFIL